MSANSQFEADRENQAVGPDYPEFHEHQTWPEALDCPSCAEQAAAERAEWERQMNVTPMEPPPMTAMQFIRANKPISRRNAAAEQMANGLADFLVGPRSPLLPRRGP